MANHESENISIGSESLDRRIKIRMKPAGTYEGTISSVDEKKYTCSIKSLNGGNIYSNVPLKVLIGSQASFIEIPKLNTNCQFRCKDNSIQRVILDSVHEVEKILIGSTNTIIKVIFNGGTIGMTKTDQLTTKLNNLESLVNDILLSYKTHIHTGGTISGSTGTIVTPILDNSLTPTQQGDIEDKNILH
jgi:hypothetical protein